MCSESPPTTLTGEELQTVLERHGSPAAIAAATGLTEHKVRLALEYWDRHPEEIGG